LVEIDSTNRGLVISPVSIFNPGEPCCGTETDASVDGRELSVGGQAILDFESGAYQISPAVGLEYVGQWYDAFTENWDGVEVRFDKDEATSLQSAMGVGISTIIPWRGIAVRPYVALDWIHEYLADARTVSATVKDTPIEFPTDEPDRDWFELFNASLAAQFELDHRFYERTTLFGGISIPLN
jgi:outer membrane autotransporter protein